MSKFDVMIDEYQQAKPSVFYQSYDNLSTSSRQAFLEFVKDSDECAPEDVVLIIQGHKDYFPSEIDRRFESVLFYYNDKQHKLFCEQYNNLGTYDRTLFGIYCESSQDVTREMLVDMINIHDNWLHTIIPVLPNIFLRAFSRSTVTILKSLSDPSRNIKDGIVIVLSLIFVLVLVIFQIYWWVDTPFGFCGAVGISMFATFLFNAYVTHLIDIFYEDRI